MHQDVKKYLLHYADIHDKTVSKMITSEIVASESDAKRLLTFIDILFKYSTQDIEEGNIILGEIVDSYAAEEGSLVILGILRANNYNTLVDNWI